MVVLHLHDSIIREKPETAYCLKRIYKRGGMSTSAVQYQIIGIAIRGDMLGVLVLPLDAVGVNIRIQGIYSHSSFAVGCLEIRENGIGLPTKTQQQEIGEETMFFFREFVGIGRAR